MFTMSCIAQILHVGPDQHFAQFGKVTMIFVFNWNSWKKFRLEITCARKFPSVQVYPPISNLAQFCLKPMFSYVVSCHYCPLSFNSLVSAGCGPSRAVSNCQLLRVSTEFKKITDLKIGIGPWINPWKRCQYSKLEGKLAQMGIS